MRLFSTRARLFTYERNSEVTNFLFISKKDELQNTPFTIDHLFCLCFNHFSYPSDKWFSECLNFNWRETDDSFLSRQNVTTPPFKLADLE